MKFSAFFLVNLILVATFIWLGRKKGFLSFFQNGKWWLTWLAVGIITLMDEMTSVFYASYEAYRFIGLKAIFYISLTSIFIRFISSRMVEIAEILENNKIRGGGVYSFSYLVFGSVVSFIAISSILVDYILTATLSTVSAIENGTSFLMMGEGVKFLLKYAVVIGIMFLNIMGIKENAKFTYFIFVFAAFVLLNLIVGGAFGIDATVAGNLGSSWGGFVGDFTRHGFIGGYSNLIVGIGSCILAYSGIESVLQTASLTPDWKSIKKAYWFLALTVGIVTPIIALMALSSNINLAAHESDLIPAFASAVNGPWFGIAVSILASFTLIMAVNTAMVASAELMEKFAEQYNFTWIMKINKRNSLYRLHIINASFYCLILFITSGSQAILAEMYAVGLVASFCINIGALLFYRYRRGTSDHSQHTSRLGTLILFIILISTFGYIMYHRPYGTLLWFTISVIVLIAGIAISKRRSPEKLKRRMSDSPMELVFRIQELETDTVHILFKRPNEEAIMKHYENDFYVSFYSLRSDLPEKLFKNQFLLGIQPRQNLNSMITSLLNLLTYEVPDKEVHIHFGWPLSSWWDRISIGVEVYKIMKLPRVFSNFNFHIEYFNLEHKKFWKQTKES